MKTQVWARGAKVEKVTDRWFIVAYHKFIERGSLYRGGDIYGTPGSKTHWFNLIDSRTGYIVNVLPKQKIKQFIKLFESMEYTHNLVDLPDYDVPVCVYTSSCGKYKVRSWTPFTGEFKC